MKGFVVLEQNVIHVGKRHPTCLERRAKSGQVVPRWQGEILRPVRDRNILIVRLFRYGLRYGGVAPFFSAAASMLSIV